MSAKKKSLEDSLFGSVIDLRSSSSAEVEQETCDDFPQGELEETKSEPGEEMCQFKGCKRNIIRIFV